MSRSFFESGNWADLFSSANKNTTPNIARSGFTSPRSSVRAPITSRSPQSLSYSRGLFPSTVAQPLGSITQSLGLPEVSMPDLSVVTTTSKGKTKTNWLMGIAVVLFIILLVVVAYFLFKWLFGKRDNNIKEDDEENERFRQQGYEAGKEEAMEEFKEKMPVPNPYGPGVPVGTSDCEDSHPNCEAWARNDECMVNPGFMLYNCKKSCQTCGLDNNNIDQIRDATLEKCQDFGDCSQANCNNWYESIRCRKTCLNGSSCSS